MEYQYKSEYIHDLDCHKEFNRSYVNSRPFTIILGIISCILLLVLIHTFDRATSSFQYFFVYAIVFTVSKLISNSKKGDIQYKRMLQANNGSPSHLQQFFTESGVHCVNALNGNQSDYGYDQFRRVIESKNLLILVMVHRTCIIINKATLEGGSPAEFFAFMKSRCPKLKGKKTRKTIMGKITGIVISVILILGTIWALLNLPGFSLMDRIYGRLDNSMSYAQMADALSQVDIHISDHAIQELVEYDNEYLSDYGESFYANSIRNQKI